MRYKLLGKTGLRVSELCLGTMTFGTPVGESDAIKLTQWALDHCVNFLDTANMYEGYTRFIGSAGGVAEDILEFNNRYPANRMQTGVLGSFSILSSVFCPLNSVLPFWLTAES